MNALLEVGIGKVMKYILFELWQVLFAWMIFSPLRVWWMRFGGANVGKEVVLHHIRLVNLYAKGLSGLKIGDDCFLGDEVMIDCAERVMLEDHVTIAMRALIITHLNVGYKNHPLQEVFPRHAKSVRIKRGSFIGANATILPGVTIGDEAFVGAGSVVTKDIPPHSLVRGVPARVVRSIQ